MAVNRVKLRRVSDCIRSHYTDTVRNIRVSPDVRVGSWSCKNANARPTRRNILGKLRVTRIDDSADMRLDAVLENCIFYILPTYEFLHSLGQSLPSLTAPGPPDVRS